MRIVTHHNDESVLYGATRYVVGHEPRFAALPLIYSPTIAFTPGAVSAVERDAAQLAVETSQRIAPWAPVIMVPRLLSLAAEFKTPPTDTHTIFAGKKWIVAQGYYLNAKESVVISYSTPKAVLKTACHEAWHALDARLSPAWQAMIDDDLAPLAWGLDDPYWTSPRERRARAFDSWCARLLEGMPGRFVPTNIDRIFAMAWSGELGDVLGKDTGKSAKVPAKSCLSRLFHRKIAS